MSIQDGGWFVDHMNAYAQNPYPLPAITGLRETVAPKAIGVHAVREPDGFRLEGWSGRSQVRVWNLSGTLLYSRPLASGDRIRLTQAHGLLVWSVGDHVQIGTGRILIP